MIGPVLHHPASFGQVLGVNVRSSNLVAFRVRQLAVYNVSAESKLTQHSGCEPAEAMSGHSRLVAHAIKREQQSVVRDRCTTMYAIENVWPIAVDLPELFQYCQRLS